MMIGISPIYIRLTHRWIKNVGPKSLKNISEDSGVSINKLKKFDETKELDAEDVMKLWSIIFVNRTFLQASALMDQIGFEA